MMHWISSWWRKLELSLSRRGVRRDFVRGLQDVVHGPRDADAALEELYRKFGHFTRLLDENNRVLGRMSDLEEKTQGEYLFDINYVRSALAELRRGIRGIVESMIALGGADYAPLRGRCARIEDEIDAVLAGGRRVEKDEYVLALTVVGRDREWSVGPKSAGLGELKTKLGLPVPEGFAVTAWAQQHFLAANELTERLSRRIAALDIASLTDLQKASADIRDMILSSPVPEDLADALRRSAAELAARSPSQSFSLRSSAFGEDGTLSFAGQYATFLNVTAGEVVERYREVLAGQFTPRALYYFLSHSLAESRYAMCAAAVSMVDAAASGVVYTRDPLDPAADAVVVSAVLGQGRYLVDGTVTPDVYRVARSDHAVFSAQIATKTRRLVLKSGGGLEEEPVPSAQQSVPALEEPRLRELAEMCLRIEAHYGGPRDIEWAVDQSGRIFLLQDRPLRVFARRAPQTSLAVPAARIIESGGTTISPGAGGGVVSAVASPEDLPRVAENAVLVTTHPFPELVTVMQRVRAIVSQTGGVASHVATLAREYRVPLMVHIPRRLAAGMTVTVDATAGVVYEGLLRELIEARSSEYASAGQEAIFALMKKILEHVSPLRLVHPADPGFSIDNCRTFHDVTRFAHQRAMEEMFSSGERLPEKERTGLRLQSAIPLPVSILFVERALAQRYADVQAVGEDDIPSAPLRAFWRGISSEGWPKPPAANLKGLASVIGTHVVAGGRREFQENSYALLGSEYMLLSLRMGYHFTTIEAMCAADISKNYIRMQYKHGGASPDRRLRRIRLIEAVLGRLGFSSTSRGDFLDTMLSYQGREEIAAKLSLLGRLNMMTKQLDMALGSDRLAHWYTQDIMKRLGLEAGVAGPGHD